MSDLPTLHVLIPCGGTGSRAGAGLPKQYRVLAGRTVLGHTLAAMREVRGIRSVLVVIAAGDLRGQEQLQEWLAGDPAATEASFLIAEVAGQTRRDTVFNGLKWLRQNGASAQDWVLVHDAARCLVTAEQVQLLIDACRDDAVGGLLAVPLPDTLKRAQGGRSTGTLDRADKWLAQTPQMFRLQALQDALAMAEADVTDEASAVEQAGGQPRLVPGSAQNFKLTYPDDFVLAENLLLARQRERGIR